MNYPLIYQKVYCEPLCIEDAAFYSVHAVLWPRIAQGRDMRKIEPLSAEGEAKQKPTKSPYNGKRASRAAPKVNYWTGEVLDSRFYYTVEGKPEVAVVPVYGILAKNASWVEEVCHGITDINAIQHALHQAMSSKEVKTIVLDIASPGGQVTGIRELAGMVRSATQQRGKRVYAFCDERMCSAAYWIGSQADEIYNTPTATVGSIGTYLAWLDESVKMQLEGVRLEFFGEGKHKGMGLPGKPLSQEDRELLQARVREINGWFKGEVSGRRKKVSDETMQGQVFTGESSPGLGLTDGLVNTWEEFLEMV
jgi:signal peptide peptidase SppA